MGHCIRMRVKALGQRLLEAELLVATDQEVDEGIQEGVDSSKECKGIFNGVSLEGSVCDTIVVSGCNFHEPWNIGVLGEPIDGSFVGCEIAILLVFACPATNPVVGVEQE